MLDTNNSEYRKKRKEAVRLIIEYHKRWNPNHVFTYDIIKMIYNHYDKLETIEQEDKERKEKWLEDELINYSELNTLGVPFG